MCEDNWVVKPTPGEDCRIQNYLACQENGSNDCPAHPHPVSSLLALPPAPCRCQLRCPFFQEASPDSPDEGPSHLRPSSLCLLFVILRSGPLLLVACLPPEHPSALEGRHHSQTWVTCSFSKLTHSILKHSSLISLVHKNLLAFFLLLCLHFLIYVANDLKSNTSVY